MGSQGVRGLRPACDPVRDGADHPRDPGTDPEDYGRTPSDAPARGVLQPPRPELDSGPVREGDAVRLVHGPRTLERYPHRPYAPLVLNEMDPGEVSREAVLPDHGRREVPLQGLRGPRGRDEG